MALVIQIDLHNPHFRFLIITATTATNTRAKTNARGVLLIQRIPDQHPKMHNGSLSIRCSCDVSMAALLCRDLEVELVLLRTNPASLRQRVAVLENPLEDDGAGYGQDPQRPRTRAKSNGPT